MSKFDDLIKEPNLLDLSKKIFNAVLKEDFFVENKSIELSPSLYEAETINFIIADGLGRMFDAFIKNQGGVENFSEVLVTKMLQAVSVMVKMLGNAVLAIERFMQKIKDMIAWTGLFDDGIEKLETSIKNWNKQIEEKVVWPKIAKTIERMKPFVNYNVTECKLLLKEVFVNG